MLNRTFAVIVTGLLLLVAPQELWAQCDVCQSCTSGADCLGGICVDTGSGGVCSTSCGTGGCPGDTVCYEVTIDTGVELLCLNPGAENAVCPFSYSCGAASCNTLGIDCSNSGASCLPDAEICLDDGAGSSFCSCYCQADADCGSGNSCVDLNSGGRGCVTGIVSNPCSGVSCPVGQYCDSSTGACVVSSGACPGLGNDCANSGQACTPSNDICLAVSAAGDSICSCKCITDSDCGERAGCVALSGGDSACVPFCLGVVCEGMESCDLTTGKCANLCAGIVCPNGGLCSPATGTCVGGSDVGPTTDTSNPPTDATSTAPDAMVLDTHNTTADQGTGGDSRPSGLGDVSGDCGCSLSAQNKPSGLILALLLSLGVFVLGRQRSKV